jgi:hypothetical protein
MPQIVTEETFRKTSEGKWASKQPPAACYGQVPLKPADYVRQRKVTFIFAGTPQEKGRKRRFLPFSES